MKLCVKGIQVEVQVKEKRLHTFLIELRNALIFKEWKSQEINTSSVDIGSY